jgi:tRNA_anti-like
LNEISKGPDRYIKLPIVSKKKIIWLSILLVLAIGAWYGFREYNRTNPDLSKVKADIQIAATDIIKEYEQNDSIADKKYLGKVVEVTGNIKKVEKAEGGYFTVVLGDATSLSSVRCAIDTTRQQDAASLTIGSSAILRGNCTGFNKDEMGLGSDVILNFSVIIPDKK